MKWFAQIYYKIHKDHPSKKNYRQLQDDFLNKVDFDLLVKYFLIYYQTFTIENHVVGSPEFKLTAKLDIDDHYEFQHLRDYLTKRMRFLNHIHNLTMEVYSVEHWQENWDELIERVEKGESIGVTNGKNTAIMMPADDELIRIYTEHNEAS